MLDNLHLVAIARNGTRNSLFHIPLHQGLQDQLALEFSAQRDAFMDHIDEVVFDAGYTPEEHEKFKLEDYVLPDWLLNESSLTVSDLESVSLHEDQIETIKGIAAFARDEGGAEVILFQNFSRSHVIRPGRFLFLQEDTYESASRPGLTLGSKFDAVFWPSERKLLFGSFRITNSFLPLIDYYAEASEQEIRNILAEHLFAPEDVDALAVGASQWFRKHFAMLRDSGIIGRYTAEQIHARSEGYEIDISVVNGRIAFPSDRFAAKRLLQFLNEEIYRGAITDTLYETNSKRETD